MQSDHKHVYKITAERTMEDEQIYKDIGNTIFAEVNSCLRKPKSLIIRLKGVGAWFLRRKRMAMTVEHFPPSDSILANEADIKAREDKIELHKIFKERLLDYDKFIETRNSIRKIRYESQTLLKPSDEGD